MGHPFDALFQKGAIDNSVEKVAHLLCITQTCSVLVAMELHFVFLPYDSGHLALNIENLKNQSTKG